MKGEFTRNMVGKGDSLFEGGLEDAIGKLRDSGHPADVDKAMELGIELGEEARVRLLSGAMKLAPNAIEMTIAIMTATQTLRRWAGQGARKMGTESPVFQTWEKLEELGANQDGD